MSRKCCDGSWGQVFKGEVKVVAEDGLQGNENT